MKYILRGGGWGGSGIDLPEPTLPPSQFRSSTLERINFYRHFIKLLYNDNILFEILVQRF